MSEFEKRLAVLLSEQAKTSPLISRHLAENIVRDKDLLKVVLESVDPKDVAKEIAHIVVHKGSNKSVAGYLQDQMNYIMTGANKLAQEMLAEELAKELRTV